MTTKVAAIHAIKVFDYAVKPRMLTTYCDERLIAPEWTGNGWNSYPEHTLDDDRVTCADCLRVKADHKRI